MNGEPSPRPQFAGTQPPALEFTPGQRVAMALLTWLPPLLAAAAFAAGWFVNESGWAASLAAFLASLYLFPPLLTRLVITCCAVRPGNHPAGSRAFLGWWATSQCQALFNRFPALEETLRLIPGLYSLWLRLWGSRVGPMVHWTPGLVILDRPWLEVGGGVVFGAAVRLHPHVIDRQPGQPTCLRLAPIVLGEGCSVGGCSLLTAGTVVAPGEGLRAFTVSPPFSRWENGQRQKPPSISDPSNP